MGKIYRKGVRYYSEKKGIQGLRIHEGFRDREYVVVERLASNDPRPTDIFGNKKVFTGTLSECRAYMKGRFGR